MVVRLAVTRPRWRDTVEDKRGEERLDERHCRREEKRGEERLDERHCRREEKRGEERLDERGGRRDWSREERGGQGQGTGWLRYSGRNERGLLREMQSGQGVTGVCGGDPVAVQGRLGR